MANTIRMDMTVDERRALQAMKKLAGGVKEMTAEEKKAVKQAKALEKATVKLGREAKKTYEQSKTAAQRYGDKVKMLNQAKAKGILTEKQHAQAVRYTKTQMQDAGAAGRRAFGPGALSMVRGMAASLGMGMGVAGAVMKITEGYQNWVEITREIATETKKASRALVEFATLQEGGTKMERALEAMNLGTRYGVTEPGLAWDIVQSMQSAAAGDFREGMKRAEVIFAAKYAGIPLEVGQEAEIFGAGKGLPPGQSIRMAQIAGEASARTAEPMARIGQAVSYWKDPSIAYAAAAVLSKSLTPGKLEVHVRRAAMGLSRTGVLQPLFEEAALGEAGPMERLRYLKKQGVTDADELQFLASKAGVPKVDVRAKKAISDLVVNLAHVERTLERIRTEAVPGVVYEKVQKIEKELPTTKLTRQLDKAEAMFVAGRAFDTEAQELELRRHARGIAADRLKFRQTGFGRRVIDEEGRVSGANVFWAKMEAHIAEFLIQSPLGVFIPGAYTGDRYAGLEKLGYPGTGTEELKKLNALTEEVLIELRTGNDPFNTKNQPPALTKPGVKDVNNPMDTGDE